MTFSRFKTILGSTLLVVSVFFIFTSLMPANSERNFKIVESFNDIEYLFNEENDTTYLINFWATTCPPCLKELPLFDELSNNLKGEKVKIMLICIDDKKRIDKYVKPYLEKLNIRNDVISLVDENFNIWTGKVNPEWYGALPYTVIYKNDIKNYFFGAFKDIEELENETKSMMIQ